MVCPRCLKEGEVVYSVLSNGLMCIDDDCGWEQELDTSEAYELVLAREEATLCA